MHHHFYQGSSQPPPPPPGQFQTMSSRPTYSSYYAAAAPSTSVLSSSSISNMTPSQYGRATTQPPLQYHPLSLQSQYTQKHGDSLNNIGSSHPQQQQAVLVVPSLMNRTQYSSSHMPPPPPSPHYSHASSTSATTPGYYYYPPTLQQQQQPAPSSLSSNHRHNQFSTTSDNQFYHYQQQRQQQNQQNQRPSAPLSSVSAVTNKPLEATHVLSTANRAADVWRCDPCDKTFGNQGAHAAHLSKHDNCSFPSCKFQGTKKVVSVHYQLMHGEFSGSGYKQIEVEGLTFKVLMGTDPNEVAEWRNQRRKRFPTKKLVEEKHLSEKERLSAGGIVLLASASSQTSSKNKSTSPAGVSQDASDVATVECSDRKRQMSCSDESQSLGDTSASSVDVKKMKLQHEVPHRRDEEPPHELDQKPPVRINKICVTFKKKGRCKFGKKCHFLHDDGGSGADNNSNDVGPKIQKNSKKDLKSECSTQGAACTVSLYGKLVTESIEKEDNMILQCLRFFVQSNYFD